STTSPPGVGGVASPDDRPAKFPSTKPLRTSSGSRSVRDCGTGVGVGISKTIATEVGGGVGTGVAAGPTPEVGAAVGAGVAPEDEAVDRAGAGVADEGLDLESGVLDLHRHRLGALAAGAKQDLEDERRRPRTLGDELPELAGRGVGAVGPGGAGGGGRGRSER